MTSDIFATPLLFLLCVIKGVESQSRCEPTELGQPHTFQCNIPGSGKTGTMIWKIADVTQCACNYANFRCDCQSATLGSSTTGGGYLATFTITSTQDLGNKNLTCVDGSSFPVAIVSSCILSVFAGPESVRCTVPASAPIGDKNVTVTCEAQKDVFPNTACLFHKITNQSNSMELSPGANVTVQPGVKTCTLRVLGTYLGPGNHQFGVVMYPDVTGDDTDKQLGARSSDTTSINIAYPSAELTDCPTVINGDKEGNYLSNGTTATCKCTTSTQPTYFPVQMTWSDKNGVLPTQSDTVTFIVTKDQVITCSVTNSLPWTKNDTYTPQVAYGPSSVDVTLEPSSQEPLDLCQAASVSFTVQCQVSSPGVSPSATFTYTVNKTSSVVPQTPADGSTSVTVTEGGVYGVTCQARNSIFSSIHAEDRVPVVVTQPPKAPIIKLFQTSDINPSSGNILTVKEGGASVSCNVTGGYPQLTGLRLSCGENKTDTNSGSQTQMNTRFTKDMNGQNCSCVATHESRCYSSHTTSYLINVLYPPSVKTFSVGSVRNVTVEKDSTLTFVCEAEGNPGPGLSLQHDGSIKDVTSVPGGDTFVTRLRHNLSVDCLHTGVYTCTAAQEQERENSSTVEVNVLCPQQLESSQSQNTVYDRKINSTFDIIVTVYGYPKPTLPLQLHGHKEDLQQDDYSVTYTETRPPLGTVTLTFYSLTEKYFQNYTLTVTNTKGSLEYNFTISGYVASTGKQEDVNVGGIVGGVIAGVVVIIVVALAVFFVRRRGKLTKSCSNKTNDKDTRDMHTLSSIHGRGPNNENLVPYRQTIGIPETAGPPSYENVVPTVSTTEKDGTGSYENVVSSTTRNTTVRGPNYENSLSFSHVPPSDDNGMLKDGFSVASNVEYENTIQSL